MSSAARTVPVRDSVPRINEDLAIGEDLEFQRRWWRFENMVWVFFCVIVFLDLVGAFGRGPVANAHKQTSDGSMRLDYERVARFSTPSLMTIHFGPSAVHDGKIQLWVSDSIIKELGNQRIVPQPVTSSLTDGGLLYTFPSTPKTNSAEFALQPSSPGVFHFTLGVVGSDRVTARVIVMP
jgi:hypothetical protein